MADDDVHRIELRAKSIEELRSVLDNTDVDLGCRPSVRKVGDDYVVEVYSPLPTVERLRSAPIFDTMQEWSKWGRERASLDLLSRAFSLPSPKESLDGSKVYPYYRAGKVAEIVEYCKCDVNSARQLYRWLTFTTDAG